jgi:hypothetical protein
MARPPLDPLSFCTHRVRLPVDLDSRIRKLAEAESRPITNMIVHLLRFALTVYTPPPPPEAPPPARQRRRT